MNMTEENGEMLVDEIQLNGSDLGEILGNEALVYDESAGKKKDSNDNSDDVYVYSGQALNQQELFKLSCREDIKLVLVAGPFSSGKTTLETMLYYIFLEGKNRKLKFCGSYTMLGFWKRSKKMMTSSGEPEPVVDRTSSGDKDWFLHLKVEDLSGKQENLVFADLSGEIFGDARKLDDYKEIFQDMENVILIVDGEKISDSTEQKNAYTETIVLLRQLLKNSIVTQNTKLQIVCTKQDKMKEVKDREQLENYLKEKHKQIAKQYQKEVYSIDFMTVSAFLIDEDSEIKKMENIMCKCMEEIPVKNREMYSENSLQKKRQFDWFSAER